MKPRITPSDLAAIFCIGLMFGLGIVVLFVFVGSALSWAGGLR